MANPVAVSCTVNTWVKVGTAIKTGFVWIKNYQAKYEVDYRETGSAAPTDRATSVPMPQPGYMINHPTAIDVYVYTEDNDGLVVVSKGS